MQTTRPLSFSESLTTARPALRSTAIAGDGQCRSLDAGAGRYAPLLGQPHTAAMGADDLFLAPHQELAILLALLTLIFVNWHLSLASFRIRDIELNLLFNLVLQMFKYRLLVGLIQNATDDRFG